jgi:ABC-type nitrate/sulfonate/bicarbonate transport system permease component
VASDIPLTDPGATRAPSARRLPGWTRRTAAIAVELVVPVAAIAAWWLGSAGSASFYFPPLTDILGSLRQTWLFSHMTSDALPSLSHLAVGYLLAVMAGVAIGTCLGLAPRVADALSPILEFLRAVPGVVLLPAALLILGIGARTQVLMIAYGSVWPILLNTADGVSGIDPAIQDVARSYRIGGLNRFFRITVRAASPQIVTGMRTALSIAITLIVFSEMEGAANGIGYQVLQSERTFDVRGMWGDMIFLGIIGYLLNVLFRGFERAVLSWHRGMRATAR